MILYVKSSVFQGTRISFVSPKVIIYLLLLKTYFWLGSDSEVEALSEDSLRLLAICSWHFSLVCSILLAKSLAYSAATSLFS